MKRFSIAVTLAACLCSAGCFRTQIINGDAVATVPAPNFDEKWNHNGIIGLVNFSGSHDVRQICPDGWARMETKRNVLAGIVGFVIGQTPIGWIYTPQNVSLYCKSN